MKKKRTRTFKAYWLRKGEWFILPSLHYEHTFNPLHITFRFLKFEVSYSSVLRYTISEFKEMMTERGYDTSKVTPGYFEFSHDTDE